MSNDRLSSLVLIVAGYVVLAFLDRHVAGYVLAAHFLISGTGVLNVLK